MFGLSSENDLLGIIFFFFWASGRLILVVVSGSRWDSVE